MKVVIDSKSVKRLCKAEGIILDEKIIQRILEINNELMFDQLIKGEDVKIPSIGKITSSYISRKSNLNQCKNLEYETTKFKFTAFKELKEAAKNRLNQVLQKHL